MTEKMKPSGIAWIGDIPQGWEMSRVKYHYEISLGKMLQPLPLALTDTFEYYMCSANITWNGISLTPLKQMWFSTSEKAQYRLRNGDLLVTEGGDVAVSCIWNGEIEECYLQNAAHRVRQFGVTDNRFLYYWLFLCKNTGYIDQICNKATIAHFTKEKFGEMPLCVMGIPEQTAISDYLDIQCAKIDSVIVDIEKQIETLQKYKKSLITEAVTKGVDRSVPMKNSNSPIIGQVKSNWVVKKLKYIVATPITDGPHETPVLLDDGVPFLSAESVKNGVLDFNYKRGYISEADHRVFCKKVKPQKGDVFVVKSGATTGNVGKVTTEEEFSIWSPLALIRCDNMTVLQDFIYYCTLSNYFRQQVEMSWSYGTQQNIGMGVLGNLKVVIPPIKEQEAILKFLDAETQKIDDVITMKQQQLETMQQHKNSLIYEYVTGKKRVTEVN